MVSIPKSTSLLNPASRNQGWEEKRKRCLEYNLCYGCEQPIYTVGHAECPVTLARKAHYADRKKRKSYGSGSVSSQDNSSQSSGAHQKVKITSRPRIKAPETVTSGEVNKLDILDIAMKSSGIQAASAQSTMDLEIHPREDESLFDTDEFEEEEGMKKKRRNSKGSLQKKKNKKCGFFPHLPDPPSPP